MLGPINDFSLIFDFQTHILIWLKAILEEFFGSKVAAPIITFSAVQKGRVELQLMP